MVIFVFGARSWGAASGRRVTDGRSDRSIIVEKFHGRLTDPTNTCVYIRGVSDVFWVVF